MTEQELFLRSIKDGAIEGWKEHSVLPSITGAQAALESAWGKSDLAKKANNFFGIKGDYQGYAYFKDSWEVVDGKNITARSAFKNYPDKSTSLVDHGEFFTSTDWRSNNYKAFIGEIDYKRAAHALKDAGYATDPGYPGKLINIIEKYDLQEWDKEAGIKFIEETKEETPVKKTGKVVGIDIGHGTNSFPPSKGVYKNGKPYEEHDFNSKLGKRLDELLEANGIEVVMAQKPYSLEVPLRERDEIYIAEEVDLVDSLHANANWSSSVNGICAFYWHSSKGALNLAKEVINQVKALGYRTHGNGLHASNYGSWTELFMTRVFAEAGITSILAEHGFMTGTKDFNNIFGSNQDKYVEDMAQAHAKAICKHLGVSYNGEAPKKEVDAMRESVYYRVQVGSFTEVAKIAKLVVQVEKDTGFTTYVSERDGAMKVQVGAFKDKTKADERLAAVRAAGYKDAFITTKSGSAVQEAEPQNDPIDMIPSRKVLVDGSWGRGFTRALQRHYGTPVDGIISGQPKNDTTKHIYSIKYGTGGSMLIRAIQRDLGTVQDGIISSPSNMIKALQKKYGTPQTGKVGNPSALVKEMQKRYNENRL